LDKKHRTNRSAIGAATFQFIELTCIFVILTRDVQNFDLSEQIVATLRERKFMVQEQGKTDNSLTAC
jgi:hypothetical protein